MSDTRGLDTLLVGLDAGCRRVLEPMSERDAVPTLDRLMDRGTSGRLESQIPPTTASAWPSLYTGVNPGKHGTFDFLTFEGYDWNVVDSSHVREHSVWEIADRHDLGSVVVNAPVTHPAKPFDGALIPGYTAPENPDCHPAGLLAEVESEIGSYRIYPDYGEDASAEERIRELQTLATMRGDAFRYLADRFQPDFGFVQFQVTDTVLHEFVGDLDRAAPVYEAVDDAVAAVIEECDPETVVVASDHGMGEYSSRFPANEFLREHGYLSSVKGGEKMPAWWTIREGRLRAGESGAESNGDSAFAPAERLAATASKFGLTSQRIGSALNRVGLAEFVERHVPDSLVEAASEQVDYRSSMAYVRSRPEFGVRINLAGREPEGVVSPDEYESVRDELIALLSGATTPDGQPVFEAVGPREDYFEGEYIDAAPDVVTIPRDFDVYVTKWLSVDTLELADQSGWDHTLDGIVAATGHGVDADAPVGDAHLFDVAPTVLASLGIEASDRMDGDPLPFVEPVGTESYPPFDADVGTGTSDDDVEEQLAHLGYLE